MRNNIYKLVLVFAMLATAAHAQDSSEMNSRAWEREKLQDLHAIERGSYSASAAVTKSLDIAKSASAKGMERLLHNALGAAVLRADAEHCDAIITFVSSNGKVRRSFLPFSELLYAKSDNDTRIVGLLSEIAREPENGGTGDYQVRAVVIGRVRIGHGWAG